MAYVITGCAFVAIGLLEFHAGCVGYSLLAAVAATACYLLFANQSND